MFTPTTSHGFGRRRARCGRRGAVAVEFAAIAPVLLIVVVAMIELTRVYHMQNTLETACREGARFAAMDRTGILLAGETANQKLIKDVKNFLHSTGIPKNNITVSVVRDSNPSQTFDLQDPDNDMELFQVRVQVPYSAVSYTPVAAANNYKLSASITFRNGRASVPQ